MTEVTVEQRQLPGIEGCSWRLVAHWDPGKVSDWLIWERIARTKATDCAKALTDVMAAAAVGFVRNMTDRRDAVEGPDGMLNLFGQCVRDRLNMRVDKTAGGVYLPRPGNW
jgi:hypothetical protein